jgi:hypothetical protein
VNRVLVSFALGAYTRLQEVALPGLEEYAGLHGYDLYTEPPADQPRPASWLKIPLLLELLDRYEEALWLDADVVVADPSRDLADDVPGEAWQALVRHHTPDGEVPNCGVWYLRRPMRPVLEQLWQMPAGGDRDWWEQGALLQLLGYRGRPVSLDRPTGLYERTHWLGLEWNSHEQNDRYPDPRFAHATCGPLGWRLQVMRRHQNPVRQPAGKGA